MIWIFNIFNMIIFLQILGLILSLLNQKLWGVAPSNLCFNLGNSGVPYVRTVGIIYLGFNLLQTPMFFDRVGCCFLCDHSKFSCIRKH